MAKKADCQGSGAHILPVRASGKVGSVSFTPFFLLAKAFLLWSCQNKESVIFQPLFIDSVSPVSSHGYHKEYLGGVET